MHLRAFPVDIREDFPSDALFQSISVHFRTIWKTHIGDISEIHMGNFLENTYRGSCVIEEDMIWGEEIGYRWGRDMIWESAA